MARRAVASTESSSSRATRVALVAALGCALAATTGCVLGVGIGGKACDDHHDCVDGYQCIDSTCIADADVRQDAGIVARDAGVAAVDAGAVDGGNGGVDAGGAGEGEGEGAPDAGPSCVPAADGIERCGNGIDDDCNGVIDDGCASNGCVDDDSFPGAFASLCLGPLNWGAAQDLCRQRGLDLAILADAKFNDVVEALQAPLNDSPVWVGGSDIATEGTFLWADGTGFRFEDFGDGQPNDLDPGQDCLEVVQGGWNDNVCDNEQGFVCARPPPPAVYTFCNGGPVVDADGDGVDCRTDCDDADPDVHPGHVEVCGDRKDNDCDGVVDEGCAACSDVDVAETVDGGVVDGGVLASGFCTRQTTHDQARDRCHDRGLQLGKIEAQSLEDAVDALVIGEDTSRCWIGLNDVAEEGTLVWDDGSPLGPFAPLGVDQPDGDDAQNCFDLRDNDPAGVDGGPAGDGHFEWGDIECSSVRGAYLCTP